MKEEGGQDKIEDKRGSARTEAVNMRFETAQFKKKKKFQK